ncbi:MAG TPA: DUF5666 domain-containing protein [Terriglobia bacterium]
MPVKPQSAEQQAPQGSIARSMGTVTAIQGNTVTLKTDAGSEVTAQVQDSTRLVRIEPGQKDLKSATPVQLQDLQAGDRILVRGSNSPDGKSILASSIILMKKGDIQQKQQQEQEDWQKRGAGGLVKAVDVASGTITIASRSGGTTKTITIKVSKDTILRHYAPDSVRFNDAKPGTLDQIKPGDQLRVRGQRNADGSEITAEEIVSGSFRNIAGTVVAVDTSSNKISVKDLATRKTVVVKVTADSQMRKLPQMMAQMIAGRLKGSGSQSGAAEAGAAGGEQATPGAANRTGSPPSGQPPDQPSGQGAGGGAGGGGRFGGGPGGRSGGGTQDFQQLLNRLPAASLADLQKGDAVMIVSTEGGTSDAVTAITLLSGVEPILTAPAERQASLLSGWGLGGGGGEAGGGDAAATPQ